MWLDRRLAFVWSKSNSSFVLYGARTLKVWGIHEPHDIVSNFPNWIRNRKENRPLGIKRFFEPVGPIVLIEIEIQTKIVCYDVKLL